MKRLILWTNLLALAACARAIPPAPNGLSPVSAIPGLRMPDLQRAAPHEVTADSTVNDLADASPDAAGVPEFLPDDLRWDIDVRSFANHPRVQYYLSYFQGISRTGLSVFLARGSRYEPMIRQRFEQEGLPGDLGYLALIESGYSNDAVSRSHAVGMWQFMKGTARGYGMRIDTWVDDRRDPVKATAAAARHLRHLRDRFGSLYLAAAAYNAGAGKLSRSLGKLQWETSAEAGGAVTADSEPEEILEEDESDADAADEVEIALDSTDITSDAAFFRLASTDLLATETQDYVPKLIAAAVIAKQPDRYGITPTEAAPFSYDSLLVSAVTGLDVIARLAAVPQTGNASAHPVSDPSPRWNRGESGRGLRRAARVEAGALPDSRGAPGRAAGHDSRAVPPARSGDSGGQPAGAYGAAQSRHSAGHSGRSHPLCAGHAGSQRPELQPASRPNCHAPGPLGRNSDRHRPQVPGFASRSAPGERATGGIHSPGREAAPDS
jgi:membrane-bound lytic murein transglycosylase D